MIARTVVYYETTTWVDAARKIGGGNSVGCFG